VGNDLFEPSIATSHRDWESLKSAVPKTRTAVYANSFLSDVSGHEKSRLGHASLRIDSTSP